MVTSPPAVPEFGRRLAALGWVTELLARGRHALRPRRRVVTVPRSAYAVTWMDQRALPE